MAAGAQTMQLVEQVAAELSRFFSFVLRVEYVLNHHRGNLQV